MKNKITYLLYSTLIFMQSCNLDVDVLSEITPDIFPQTEEDFIAAAGPVYSKLTEHYSVPMFFLQEATADGLVLTANGGNWLDDFRYRNHHLHTWEPDQRFIREGWLCCFQGISLCNSLLPLFEKAPESRNKPVAIAEIRAMRAWYYYMAMDLWGDVPLVTAFGEGVESGPRVARSTIFEFIESELKDAIPDLSEDKGIATYGRPNRWMAYAFLAKIYLNAVVYTGENRYNDVIAACDHVINEATAKGEIALDDDYLKMFYPDNGPQIKDFLFAVPFDANNSGDVNYPGRYWLSPLHREIYGLPYGPSSCMRTWPEFYAKFTIDETDVRQKIWLAGKQYLDDGTPVMVPTTNKGLDDSYDGPAPDAAIYWHMEFTPEIIFRNLEMFETGNDMLGRHVGYRSIKFFPDLKAPTRAQSNDIPVFRYADVLLMKAEAILRGASPTMGHTAVSLVNMVRSRSKASLFTAIDLDELLDERARELCFEYWRRNDLIRFGKFEESWGVKTNNDPLCRVLPIPLTELRLNPAMTQNPGYTDISR